MEVSRSYRCAQGVNGRMKVKYERSKYCLTDTEAITHTAPHSASLTRHNHRDGSHLRLLLIAGRDLQDYHLSQIGRYLNIIQIHSYAIE